VAEVWVRDSVGRAVAGAQVALAPLRSVPGLVIGRSGVTGDDGRVRLPGLPAGRATLTVRRIGFRALSREVALAAAGTAAAPLEVTLDAVPQQLASVVVRASRRGPYTGRMGEFYRRRDLGQGSYFTAADIDRRNPLRTSDLLRMVPGAAVFNTGTSSTVRFRSSGCDPFVWIDGAPASAGYLDIDIFAPGTLAGVEVYRGAATVPVELRGPRGQGGCGVIALWTRMPEPTARRRGNRTPVTAEMLARLVETATVFTAEQVDEAARLDSTHTLAPRYPDQLRRTRTPGNALVEFVVDTSGRVEPETVGLVSASLPEFAQAAREAAAEARFLPARRAGRPVRQLAQLPLVWEGR
jgi:TonB family protein